MAAILQTFLNTYCQWKLLYFDQNLIEVFFPEGQLENMPALLLIYLYGFNLLPEPMMTQFTDACIRFQASMC